MEFFGIGHSRRDILPPEKFCDLLHKYHIDCVVDIRLKPTSSYNRKFTSALCYSNGAPVPKKKLLHTILERGNTLYVDETKELPAWLPVPYLWLGYNLGNPEFHTSSLRLYKQIMADEGDERLKALLLLKYEHILLMCACGNFRKCHRSVLADYLEKRGYEYQDIQPD